MTTTSPSAPSEIVGKVLRGGRKMRIDSKVQLSENGLEDMDQFWDSAKTPRNSSAKKPKRRQPLKQDNRRTFPTKALKRAAPRFSIDGNADEGSEGMTMTDISEFRSKLQKGAFSPGDLSRVSTAPPTPKETPESTRAAQLEEGEVTIAVAAQRKSPAAVASTTSPMSMSLPFPNPSPEADDFPMDDDEGDDLVPPPPPEDMEPEPSEVEQPAHDIEFPTGVDQEETKSIASKQSSEIAQVQEDEISIISRVSVNRNQKEQVVEEDNFDNNNDDDDVVEDDNDDDDDDKEGVGFVMRSPAVASQQSSTIADPTPQSKEKKKAGRPKKRRSEDGHTTPVPRKSRKKHQREKTLFSPEGYPVGAREMNPVPVSDYKESPPEGVRRSHRAHMKPLAYWKNERPLFGPHDEDGELGDEMGCMPVVKSVLVAGTTPRKQRKPVAFAAGLQKHTKAQAGTIEDEVPFDSRRLRKKYKIIDDDRAHMWDEELEDLSEQKVVSYADNLTASDLPLPSSRKKIDGKVVGRAAQSFNIPSGQNDILVGFIMGNLTLPPKGLKDSEATGTCSQVFTVCSCQPSSLEVAYGDPQEEEGTLRPESAQRFLLSAGDQFRIPPGNAYQLKNHSSTTDSFLAWTIIRPRLGHGGATP